MKRTSLQKKWDRFIAIQIYKENLIKKELAQKHKNRRGLDEMGENK